MPAVNQTCNPQVAAKVAYEMRMFRYAYDKLTQLQVDMSNILPGNVMPRVGTGLSTEEVRHASALVECFLIHARVLRDFFRRGRQKPDDVIAGDFVSGWTQPSASDYGYVGAQKEQLLSKARAMHRIAVWRV